MKGKPDGGLRRCGGLQSHVHKGVLSLRTLLSLALLAACCTNAATVCYVNLNTTNATPPYTDWSTASADIQSAIDVASTGDEIVVAPGVYATGSRSGWGGLSRVVVSKAVVVRSLSGPNSTIIQGYQLPGVINGVGAIRCVMLTNDAVLSGFTLTRGATLPPADGPRGGGGAFCLSQSAMVTNCILAGNSCGVLGGGVLGGTLYNCMLTGNSSGGDGGGAASSTLNNCVVVGNSAASGGGGAADNCTLNNCTVTGNSATTGGGVDRSSLNNCIVYFNAGVIGPNYNNSSLNYCCATPLSESGSGNLSVDPQLASQFRLAPSSPCRGAGNAAYASGVDIDGEPWASPPSIGCDEFQVGAVTGPLSVTVRAAYTNVALGFGVDLTGFINGCPTTSRWDFGDGQRATNQPYANHAWSSVGDYTVVLMAYNESYPAGVSTSVVVHVVQRLHYVDAASSAPSAPYACWATAARTIQEAVDVAAPGAFVLVTNGEYSSGGRAVSGQLTNRVAVSTPLTLQSVNGPTDTLICGYQVPGTTNGDRAIRCVYLTNGAVLSGFTLTNGATRTTWDTAQEESGGGVWCAGVSAVLTNCVLVGNSATYHGGGACGGTLNNCTLSGNSGGGAYGSTLNHCALTGNSGGGASGGILNHCTLASNSAHDGGGASGSTLNHCTLMTNLAVYDGGGAYYCTLNDCILTGNSAGLGAITDGGYGGGGTYECTLNDCTLTGNSAGQCAGGGTYYSTLNHCLLTGNSAWMGGGVYAGTLTNCTLTGNSAESGGGTYGGILHNCTLSGNSAGGGGGACCSILHNCLLVGNSAWDWEGGGADASTLTNCTLTGNWATNTGGGAYYSTLNNCIVYYNSAPVGPNYSGSTLKYCCATPLAPGVGNLDAEPQLASASHLSALSPCRQAGSAAYVSGTDIDGEPWANSPSIGCDEFTGGATAAPISVSLQASYTHLVVGFSASFTAGIEGPVTASRWEFGDGTSLSNRPYAAHAWSAPGDYAVVLWAYNESHPGGVSATALVQVLTQAVYYVALGSPTPQAPYDSWATAATNIQDAVDAAQVAGASVLVSNGVYQSGARVVYGALANRVVVTKPLVVRSVNGPEVTVIRGYRVPGTTNGDGAVRCAYLANDDAWLVGFTLTEGATRGSADWYQEECGGGLWCEIGGVVSNCLLTSNSAYYGGGAAYGGRLNNCTLTGNGASFGGGAYSSTLNNCLLTGNSAWNGGGALGSTLNNCTLTGNTAAYRGGGANGSTLDNCTLTGNRATNSGGGVFSSTLTNSIVYFNMAPSGVNYFGVTPLKYCCTTPLPTNGLGNLTNEPLFVNLTGGDLHLQANSPCINAGLNSAAPGPVDLDGRPRILGGTVDMGAYESATLPQLAGLQAPGPDGMALSLSGDPGGVVQIYGSSNLTAWFWLATLTNTGGRIVYTDPSATNQPLRFYKALQLP
jgi:hypothetical protein